MRLEEMGRSKPDEAPQTAEGARAENISQTGSSFYRLLVVPRQGHNRRPFRLGGDAGDDSEGVELCSTGRSPRMPQR